MSERQSPKRRSPFRRRKYRNAPIEEAICEVRFNPSDWDPTIPGRFYQDPQIKKDYPAKPREVRLVQTELSAAPSQHTSFSIKNLPARTQFAAEDDRYRVSLGPDTISISALKPYSSWELFRERIDSALAVHRSVAEPQGLTRVGVRYVNIVEIDSSEAVKLHDYFTCAPQDLSEEKHNQLPKSLLGVLSRQEYRYDDNTRLTRVFANANARDGHIAMLLDLDVYWQPLGEDEAPPDLSSLIERLRSRERVAFEASITDACRKLFSKK